MKAVQLEMTPTIIDQIRAGQMFQVQSRQYGNFKSPAYRSEMGWLYFKTPTNLPVLVEDVDTLLYLDPLR